MSEESPVFLFQGRDPEMLRAHQWARATFGFFWRELAWEYRRIVPALDLACVKAPFSDDPDHRDSADQAEHMWINEVTFDGADVRGVLINEPNWLKSVRVGDQVSVPLPEISDWMYSLQNRVYGGFTINLIRKRMKPGERIDHDEAWGLTFGDPENVDMTPPRSAEDDSGLIRNYLGGKPPREILMPAANEHPMSASMGPMLEEFLTENPDEITGKDADGWTMLHHQALAGSVTSVSILLQRGANASAKTPDGRTAADLARSLGWSDVLEVLDTAD